MTLETRGLAFGYRGRTVGRDVDLLVRGGEVLALLGPNGGGKTTLLKTLLGLLRPHAGEVLLNGRPLAALTIPERARRVAYVPQVQGGTFAFTALEVVLMGRTAHGGLFARPTSGDRALALRMLERLGVAHLVERPTTMVSGGERQLVLIARALAQEPRFVVLDEPTASLDFSNQGKVMREIRALADERGLGVVFTTHDPNQALRYADRTLLLRDGARLGGDRTGAALDQAALEALYGAPVEVVADRDTGARAFLPG